MIPWYALILDCLFGAWLCSKGTPLQGWTAIATGLLACRAALSCGLPIWADEPFDATDIGLIAFIAAWAILQIVRAA